MNVFTNDCGFIAIVENGRLVGYNLSAGGGLGMSHGIAQTFPRLADVIGFARPEQVIEVAKGVVTVHRDFRGSHQSQTRAADTDVWRSAAWLGSDQSWSADWVSNCRAARPFEFTPPPPPPPPPHVFTDGASSLTGNISSVFSSRTDASRTRAITA